MTYTTGSLNARDQQIVRLLVICYTQSDIVRMMDVNRSLIAMRMENIRKAFTEALTGASFSVQYA